MDHNYYLVLPNFVCCHFYGDGVRTKKKRPTVVRRQKGSQNLKKVIIISFNYHSEIFFHELFLWSLIYLANSPEKDVFLRLIAFHLFVVIATNFLNSFFKFIHSSVLYFLFFIFLRDCVPSENFTISTKETNILAKDQRLCRGHVRLDRLIWEK